MSRVAVIGPGAIGGSLAACLYEAGVRVSMYGRTARDSIEVRPDGEAPIRVPGPVLTEAREIDGPADIALVAVKGTQVPDAAPLLAALISDTTLVCVLQNGMEHEESVRPFICNARVAPCIVWFPAEVESGGWIRLRSPHPRIIVSASVEGDQVARLFESSRVNVERVQDFSSIAWRKLIQNAVTGLMVLTGRRCGMYQRHDISKLALDYARECVLVARADGASVEDNYPETLVAMLQDQPGDMITSILADRIAGRELEWKIRNEVILRRAKQYSVHVPVSSVVVPLLAAASDGPG
jgi:2-dehydropantoate 2-reductase